MFGDRRRYVNGQSVRLREIDGFEVDAGLDQVRDEGDIARDQAWQ